VSERTGFEGQEYPEVEMFGADGVKSGCDCFLTALSDGRHMVHVCNECLPEPAPVAATGGIEPVAEKCACEPCDNPRSGGRLCTECEDATIQAAADVARRRRERDEMMRRRAERRGPTPIERMIDAATGYEGDA
jgi:hypothetical protein